MPFGLKNAGATYQRLMERILSPMLEHNVQTYMDDMVITSEREYQHVTDLEELFAIIARYNLKFNLDKCVFGVKARKFLGFLVIERGIEVNPDKCTVIVEMRSPTNVKEMQQLTGRMAALSHFLSAGGEKGYPYFLFLKKNNHFAWTDECKRAFVKLKDDENLKDAINRRNGQGPKHLKFFLLVFSKDEAQAQEGQAQP